MTAAAPMLKLLTAEPVSAEAFAPFGQVIFPTPDGTPYGPHDAQLHLSNGIPRLYLMTLTAKGRRFDRITRHQRSTQCLGALNGRSWWIAVAPPGAATEPEVSQIRAFQIPGHCFINLAAGTWHAGPYFEGDAISFYNLELSDTNITDHHTCNLRTRYGLEFEIVPQS